MQKNLEIITSRKNAGVLAAAALAEKKQRDKTGLFAFEGIKLFCDALGAGMEIEKVFLTERAFERYGEKLAPANGKLALVSEEVYAKLSFENAPQGVFTVAKKRTEGEKAHGARAFALFLDTLGDPGNLGTVIRSAEAFGADTVFVGEGSADIYNPKTVRAAMGSLFRVDVRACTDIAADIAKMRGEGFRVYAAMLDKTSKSVCELELAEGKVGFVIGNEGHGVRESVRAACTGSVIVPMCEGPESLNAAICSSLLSWEVFRARM
ncbi:MAG: RNA methyltransferase [Clostridia bacterium]|nr:RNA methyltransferase [Clostridia bacterium]